MLVHSLLFIWKMHSRNQTLQLKEYLVTLHTALYSFADYFHMDIAAETTALSMILRLYFEMILPKWCLEESPLEENDFKQSNA